MRNSNKVIAAVVCLAALASLLLFARRPAEAPAPAPGAAQSGPRVLWPERQRLDYTLSWHARTSGEIAPGSSNQENTLLNLAATVEGEVSLQRAGGTDQEQRVALSYVRFDKFSFDMQGQDAQAQVEQMTRQLAGQAAFLTIDERGRIGSITFPPEMQPAARSVLRALALQLGYTLPPRDEESWEADEANTLGEAHVRYRRGAGELAREPVAFNTLDVVRGPLDGKQELRGGALIALDSSGLPVSIDETTDVVYTRRGSTQPAIHSGWTFSLHRKDVVHSDAALASAAGRAQPQPLRAPIDDPDRARRRDQRMAQGLNADDLALMFDRFEKGTRPGHQFLVRAAAYLRLHPEAFPMVLAKFTSPELTVRGRGLILDVLAETGNAPAQAAMRTALASTAAHAKPHDFPMLVQRFTFVFAPEPASVRFVEETYDAARRGGDVESAQGAAVALGSVVRRLTIQNELGAANEVNERLRAELRAAQTPELRGALVAALGNAARKEDVADIVALASDSDAKVRDQVAGALRTVDSPEAREALFSLVADSSTGVANRALDALRSQSLGDSDWQALEQIAQQGSSPVSSDAALLNLVKDKDQSIARPEARQILTALLARNRGGDNDLPGIIRGLLSTPN